ncbi:MAG: hypothetical protein IT306_09215 [Chloroflexi bacterium]|nr:hypothetical protein [Chloroflexota bacterium]
MARQVLLGLLFAGVSVIAALILLPPRTALAHDGLSVAAPTDRQRDPEARSEASELTEELRGATAAPPKGPAVQAAITTKAQRRQALINRLAQSDPSAVLDLALTPAERAALPPQSRQYVEERVSVDGEFQVFHVDYEDGHSEYITRLAKDGRFRPLALGASIGAARPGDVIQTNGVALAGSDAVVSDQMVVIQSPSAVGTTGNQRTAIILAMGSGIASHPYANKANTASIFFSSANAGSARNYYYEASYGQTLIVGGNGVEGTAADVYGPYSIAATDCNTDTIRAQAFAAADPDLNFGTYDRVVISVMTTTAAGCGSGGVGTVRSQYQGSYDGAFQYLSVSWDYNNALGSTALNGKIGGVAVHEYGHNIGVWHANSLDCGTSGIGTGICYSTEYGDPADVMGNAGGYGHPNGVHKDALAWLNGGRSQTVTTNGSYQLNAYEDGTANVKVLRIPRTRSSGGTVNGYYYLEYRKPTATWNGFLSGRTEYGSGVLVHASGASPLCTAYCNPDFSGSGGGGDSNLVDTSPASSSGTTDFNDAPLSLTESYDDDAAGLTIRVTETGATSATVSVSFTTPRLAVRTVIYPTAAGQVSGVDTTYTAGQSVTLTASPSNCFIRWRENRANQSYTNPYTFTIQSDRLIEAVFQSTSSCAPAPANDAFPGSTVNAGQQVALTTGATTEASEPTTFSCAGSSLTIGKTAWYTYTPASSGTVTMSTAGSSFDTVLRVYSGGSVGSLSEVACNDDISNNVNTASQVQFSGQAGTAYRVQVGGYNSGSGNAILTIAAAQPPAADPRQEGPITVAGNLTAGGTATFTVSIKNYGGIATPALHPYLGGTNFVGSAWQATVSSPTSAVIQPGATTTFTVQQPLATGGPWTMTSVGLWNDDTNSDWKALPPNGQQQPVMFQVAIACSPRPKVNVATRLSGDGRLLVVLSASATDVGNRILSVQFGADSHTSLPNALIDTAELGNGRSTPGTVQLAGAPSSYTFYVRRQTPGLPATVALTVTDLCGNWQTLVGGGTSAGF